MVTTIITTTAIFLLTAYCNASGVSPYGITASMTPTHWGVVACGNMYPFGTQFVVEDMETVFVCEDRGGGITNDRLDLWFPSCYLARQFGVRYRWVTNYVVVRRYKKPYWMWEALR